MSGAEFRPRRRDDFAAGQEKRSTVTQDDLGADIDTLERDFRRRWHRAHIDAFELTAAPEAKGWREHRISPHAEEARQFLATLRRTRDLSAFQLTTNRWTRSFSSGYAGAAGQMIINQINKMSPDPDRAVTVLLDALSVPEDLDDAVRKIRLLSDHLETIRMGAHPSPKRAPFVASYYWGLEAPGSWPVAWPKSSEYHAFCTGTADYSDQGDRYADLYDMAMSIDGDPQRFEQVAAWWSDERPVVVDQVLCDRAGLQDRLRSDDADPGKFETNARVLVAVAQHIGHSLESEVAQAAGRTLKASKPSLLWTRNWPRGDTWAEWKVPDSYGLGVRLWINGFGMAVGLRPYRDAEAGATDRAVAVIERHPLTGYDTLASGRSKVGLDVGFRGGGSGEVMYGKWFDRNAVERVDVPTEIIRAAEEVAPLIAELAGDEPDPDDDDLAEPALEFNAGSADPLGELADELLVSREFVAEVVELLEDKGQVVFYGPPGTGKTYFARKLAAALVPDAERRPIVQFHPSTSYEDFFEGFRPETDADGVMTYRLQRGPLAGLAALASDAPGRRHLMIIDEINRANLPKVLGEMLFLLENRDTPVRTLYRPEDPFQLSNDIWFIGTMNTADRSIALVDAALRRRFHFVPFFPHHGEMEGLLDRWLAREEEPAWVGELVAQVNAELVRELGGPHLQLGPSHFMKHGLDKEKLGRIWKYNIEPFIEDQFFGDAARIAYFRFDSVFARFDEVAGEAIDDDADTAAEGS